MRCLANVRNGSLSDPKKRKRSTMRSFLGKYWPHVSLIVFLSLIYSLAASQSVGRVTLWSVVANLWLPMIVLGSGLWYGVRTRPHDPFGIYRWREGDGPQNDGDAD